MKLQDISTSLILLRGSFIIVALYSPHTIAFHQKGILKHLNDRPPEIEGWTRRVSRKTECPSIQIQKYIADEARQKPADRSSSATHSGDDYKPVTAYHCFESDYFDAYELDPH